MAAQNPNLTRVRPNGLDDMPVYQIDIDQEKASALGLSLAGINSSLTTVWGSTYVNDFIDKGRVKKVYLQADAPYRMVPEDLDKWYVRNTQGDMVPFSMFARNSGHLVRRLGVQRLAAVEIRTGGAGAVPRVDAGDGRPRPLRHRVWHCLDRAVREERSSRVQAPLLYGLSIVVVFLCLAALYESWSIPFAVLMIIPLGVLGALLAASGRGLTDDVYFQVGLQTTIGLSAKNAISIIQFAQAQILQGVALAGNARGRATQVAPDPDDLARVRRRRATAGVGERRRLGQPERDRHWRLRRDVRGHFPGPAVRAAVLRRCEATVRAPPAAAECCRTARPTSALADQEDSRRNPTFSVTW
jgi:multidrug efflux pump subunit AcrB